MQVIRSARTRGYGVELRGHEPIELYNGQPPKFRLYECTIRRNGVTVSEALSYDLRAAVLGALDVARKRRPIKAWCY